MLMLNAPIRTVFDVITDFLASEPSLNDILAYHLPDDLQERVDYLLERNSAGLLSPEEAEEMQLFMNADEMIALLKGKIKLKQS